MCCVLFVIGTIVLFSRCILCGSHICRHGLGRPNKANCAGSHINIYEFGGEAHESKLC